MLRGRRSCARSGRKVVDKTGRADPVEVIKMILDAGADVNASMINRTQRLHLAARRECQLFSTSSREFREFCPVVLQVGFARD